ncbi:DNA-binding transcriptional regulator, MerR family [Eubacterium maltosivorans]|uniref:MerR family transcriptional regulator n=1 Tax=Eubacterium maltosivorans TaxID=2041044 RepID=UPI00088593B8|nr:MerR family transcriptional regulator [Eubacterium maltosivorans]WPK79385.1 hypothetical protein EUMA32_07920 [Eubacterium maltosivorans]SDP42330.1 DNA-binding transcriptional regulator, MerR family [Eubacterium maltosivorans]
MRINEIEKLLDVPASLIRFYEREGLLNPVRLENGYRDYSEADVQKLNQILVLRKLGFTLNDISDLSDGVMSLEEALAKNAKDIRSQMRILRGALLATRKMQGEQVNLDDLKQEKYLKEIKDMENRGICFFGASDSPCEMMKHIREMRKEYGFSTREGWSCERRRNMCPHFKTENPTDDNKKEENKIRIAVPYDNGNIFPAFGAVQNFKLYDVENQKIVSEKIIDNGGAAHWHLVHYLAEQGVTVVLCENIGSNGYNTFMKNKIEIYCGIHGNADEAVKAFLEGTLDLSIEPTGCVHDCDSEDNKNK